MAAQAGMGRGQVLVNKQFNSPIKLYSPENVAEVLNKQTQVLENGAVGIDFHQLSAPGHLANSAVLRMLAEEERQRGGALKEESPPPLTPAAAEPATADSPEPAPDSDPGVVRAVVAIPTSDEEDEDDESEDVTASDEDNDDDKPGQVTVLVEDPIVNEDDDDDKPEVVTALVEEPFVSEEDDEEDDADTPEVVKAVAVDVSVNEDDDEGNGDTPEVVKAVAVDVTVNEDDDDEGNGDTPEVVKAVVDDVTVNEDDDGDKPEAVTALAEEPAVNEDDGGDKPGVVTALVEDPTVNENDEQLRRERLRTTWIPREYGIARGYNNVTLKHPLLSSSRFPISKGLKRVAWPPPPESEGTYIESQPVFSKFQASPAPAAALGQPGQPQYPPPLQPFQFPSYQAPVFEPPPATVVLRPEPPISQAPFPVFESQPAATRAAEPKMRGDEKWPPVQYKEAAAAENEQRKALARGPAVRPRKVNRDYSKFFQQHALTPNYPTYKAPPGTQHYVEEGTSDF